MVALLLKKSPGSPYLKIFDLSQLFIAAAPTKRNPLVHFYYGSVKSPMNHRVKGLYLHYHLLPVFDQILGRNAVFAIRLGIELES